MESFDRDKAVRSLIDFAFAHDELGRRAYRKVLEDGFSDHANFLWNDLGMVLEAYANQQATPASQMPNAVWPCIDHSEFKQEIPHVAYRYMLLSALHEKKLTEFLCRALLDSEIYPLAREMDKPASALPSVVGPRATFQLHKQEQSSGWLTTAGILLILLCTFFAVAGDLLPDLPWFIRRVCSGFGPCCANSVGVSPLRLVCGRLVL
jgi:hypothetical protein